ncbi:hypothetical protein [Rhizobium sp. SSA_523]|uniref:hypothetical protein n=1 Tax=Rhizobium sp. SSA_523 TaxID=2952477 RepID=UPI002090C224|nr:hypothetical protein [Rhizobium sp. SSA_523]MCO5731793.1 hypothetical protein [Rhizobium sp. SSA_523]WKC22838.1 hypothetical protein QTJ18_18570 [Rhizobium sp. SSA_523]
MGSIASADTGALSAMSGRWEKLGYTLIIAPDPDELPDFLRQLKPQAIGINRAPKLAIFVVRAQSRTSEVRLAQLRSVFEAHPDWTLEVVYDTQETIALERVAQGELQSAISSLEGLAPVEPRAAVLLGWSVIEAATRRLEPELADRSLTPTSLVDLLISSGHLEQRDGGPMRRLAHLRNALAHGQIDTIPAATDIDYLVATAKRLAA